MEDGLMRVNITMSIELKEWFQNEAKKDGIPYSSLMVIALREYRKQCEGLNNLVPLLEFARRSEK